MVGIPKKVSLGNGEQVLFESKGFMYTEKPSLWAGAQGKAPMETFVWLTNQRIIAEPKVLGGLAKVGLLLTLGLGAAGVATSQMFQSGDAIAIPLPNIISAETFDFHRQRMIKLVFGAGSKTGELYIGLERKEDVPVWCMQVQHLRIPAVSTPNQDTPKYQPTPQTFNEPPLPQSPIPQNTMQTSGTIVYCIECGMALPATAKFCKKCGTRQ